MHFRYGSYILTKDAYEEATASSPMFGLDCEMCLTTSGNLELTRISVVDESMNVSTIVKHLRYLGESVVYTQIYFNFYCRLCMIVWLNQKIR